MSLKEVNFQERQWPFAFKEIELLVSFDARVQNMEAKIDTLADQQFNLRLMIQKRYAETEGTRQRESTYGEQPHRTESHRVDTALISNVNTAEFLSTEPVSAIITLTVTKGTQSGARWDME